MAHAEMNIRSLSNHNGKGAKNITNFQYLTVQKQAILNALQVHFFN